MTDSAESDGDEHSIVDKVGNFLLVACGIVFLIPTLFIVRVLSKRKSRIRKWYNRLYYSLFWNGIIVYLLESY